MNLDFLEDNTLIICPTTYKENILTYLSSHKRIINIKFMTMEEYTKNYYFDYDAKALFYLSSGKRKVENALELIKNMYFIEDKSYSNRKLDYLVSLKRELDEQHLLNYNYLFPKMLEKYKIIVYGYGMINNFQKRMFSNAKIIPYSIKNNHFTIYQCKNINEEVESIFAMIVDLLRDGVNLNKIKLMNINGEYYSYLKRMAKYYDIPLDIDSDENILGTTMGKRFYHLILEGKKEDEIYEELDGEYAPFFINLLNKYSSFGLYQARDLIKYELLNKKIEKRKLENVLQIKRVFDDVLDDEYIFFMGFNNGSVPHLYSDTDYITDNLKNLLSLPLTSDLNNLSRENTLNYLKSINHLIISYKEISPFNTYYPSILLDDMDCEIKKGKRSNNYSVNANKEEYTKELDDLIKYGIKNKQLELFYSNYNYNNYLEYNNDFTGLNNKDYLDYIENNVSLSYSSIDNYYKCGFKYYLSNVLKIDFFEETFYTFLGSLFHEVLSHMNEDNFDLDYYYNKYLEKKEFSNKELFFLNKLKSDLSFIIDVIHKHQFITGFNKMLYEQKIDIPIKKSPYVHFKGFIDKIMYREKSDETLVSIIDYKTGHPDIKIKNLKFGLSMQLPIYLYLVKNSNIFQNVKFAGFYLQHILNFNISNSKKDEQMAKEDNLKLIGYSTSSKERLAVFDSTYENSEMIKGMKVTKEGNFSNHAKVLSDDEINDIISKVEEKILLAMEDILKAKFNINPKIINGKNVSCEHCKFKDICYHEEKNNVYLETEEGESDAQLDEGTE